jgi:hypothetical protein
MPDAKTDAVRRPAASPDSLTETKNVALNESDLAKVSGGGTAIVQDVTVNKAKTADKAYAAMDGYIKG